MAVLKLIALGSIFAIGINASASTYHSYHNCCILQNGNWEYNQSLTYNACLKFEKDNGAAYDWATQTCEEVKGQPGFSGGDFYQSCKDQAATLKIDANIVGAGYSGNC
ncbi:hypothetical protein F52700_12342 [Fusarium sp. NRRL 52700]|nr:hypothetical protein F52700_12342 [Fusarium sp. NRRL 52700]